VRGIAAGRQRRRVLEQVRTCKTASACSKAVPAPRRHCVARRITRYGCNNFEQHSERVLQKEASGGLQESFGGSPFLFDSNSSHIWLLLSGWEAFCWLLKSRVLLFPQFLNLVLFTSMPFWQGDLKNELYFPSRQGRGSGGSRKTDG